MKTTIVSCVAVAIVSAFCLPPSAFGQGALTPPGAPAPTMKSLDQLDAKLEKRVPISALPYSITNSGSYHLASNVVGVASSDGISIVANNVTLDLNGFAVTGVTSSGYGINIAGVHTNITVRNGNISGWGNGAITVGSSSSRNIVFDHLNISEDTSQTAVYAINALVSDCTIEGGFNGIVAINSRVRNCLVSESGNAGIYADYSTVKDCQIQNCSVYGIYINAPGCLIVDNMLRGNNSSVTVGGAGIYVNDSNNRIENNQVTASGWASAGILVNGPAYVDNVVIKNTVSGNGFNDLLGTDGNDFGPTGSASSTTSPWANISH
jgi:hypothetical protein